MSDVIRFPMSNEGNRALNVGDSKSPKGNGVADKKVTFTKVLVSGLSQLIESQRQFSEKFDIPLKSVFPKSADLIDVHTSSDLAISLFTNQWRSSEILNLILSDLIEHQAVVEKMLVKLFDESKK